MKLRIRDLREDRDLNQKEIADYLLCRPAIKQLYPKK